MRYRRLFISLFTFITLLLLVPPRELQAAPNYGDEVVLGDDLTLREGEHIAGDLVLIGGDLTTLAGSRVEGSITALGGRVEIDGTVEGDVIVLGGDANLGMHARITGDVVTLGGQLHQAEGAQMSNVVTGPTLGNLNLARGLRLSSFFPNISSDPTSAAWAGLTALVSALLMAGLGVAIVVFWPTQTSRVGETILKAPLPSLGIGCLAYPLAASLTFFVLITVCLAPFVPIVALLVVASTLLGWVALGMLFGRLLARWMGWQGATQLTVTGVGVFSLTIIAAVVAAVPCLGSLLTLGAASIGLGAVALSRFGTSPWKRRAAEPPAEA